MRFQSFPITHTSNSSVSPSPGYDEVCLSAALLIALLAFLHWQGSGRRLGFFSVGIGANDGQTLWKLYGAIIVTDRCESASLIGKTK